jgi:hypothetical protein
MTRCVRQVAWLGAAYAGCLACGRACTACAITGRAALRPSVKAAAERQE